ncbi:sirohydrochlorin chelatase [Thermobifida cellulosilytica]|uniref:Cobalamin biosynthesis protein CbiX n=1 Tax=Thermobifida cellulosilytica TB100 TaxID=665004 RepID=A0A147KHX3_THECS|nr:cobalamin biosynthesis protein CbiX [Thermobifida cellulosilytica]KUP96904.1 cobalamin biosynthesis protein CbiX [Thermobifida cellulosilytica TB100]
MHNSDRLPPRVTPRRRSGRHRDPLSFDKWVGTPPLVLVAYGPAGDEADGTDFATEMVDLVRPYRPETSLHLARTHGEADRLAGVLAEVARREGEQRNNPCDAVIVPLVAGPHQPTLAAIDEAVRVTGVNVRVTDPLGPHPMLAEALHLRLAEASYVRADRMRLISVVAPSDTMADGVLVGSAGGPDAFNAAGITAVLLAARLGVTVLPAALDDPAQVEQAFAQLAAAGCRRPVIAPSIVGQEFPAAEIAALAGKHGARASAPLGANTITAKIVALRYAEMLNSLGVEQQAALEDLPAPAGARHRREN